LPGKITLGEELFAKGKIAQARQCFLEVLQEDADNKQALNNLGVLAFQSNEADEAEGYFARALEIDPNYEECRGNLTILRRQEGADRQTPTSARPTLKNVKLAIVNLFPNKFNQMYYDYFSRDNEVRLIIPKSERDLEGVIDWADVIWTIWCNEPLRFISRRAGKITLVTHIHSYEILTPALMTGAHWDNIDGAIFVADHMREIANQMWPKQLQSRRQRTIHNCVQLERYPFYDKTPGKNIAYVGYLNHKKGIPLLLQCIQKAIECDPAYRFHIAGSFQEQRFEVYMNHLLSETGLTDKVTFHGWVRDIPAFLADMDYVISTSPWEGCPYNVIEAMACGIKPLVHNWRGAAALFGRDLVFNTVDEFSDQLVSSSYDSGSYRDFVGDHFNAQNNLPMIDSFLAELHYGEASVKTTAGPTATTSAGPPSSYEPPVTAERPKATPSVESTEISMPPREQAIDFCQPLSRDVGVSTDRKRLTIDLCRGRRVLHIGCVDAGMMERRMAENNFLHYHITQVAKHTIGADIDEVGLAALKERGYDVHRLDLETDLDLLTRLCGVVDLVVIPEVIEHLNNPGRALTNLRRTGFKGDILISVPNAFSFRAFSTLARYQELVHPDHNYWFSPTTLRTLLVKHGFEIKRTAMHYWRGDDPIGREFENFMKTCPYYGDGIVVVVRAIRGSSETQDTDGDWQR